MKQLDPKIVPSLFNSTTNSASRNVLLDLLVSEVSDLLTIHGQPINDIRFERTVLQSVGVVVGLDQMETREALRQTPIEKYRTDWENMSWSFVEAVNEAYKDPESRQIVFFNDGWERKPCFNMFQVIANELVVTMRSSDITKLYNDICFFGWVANMVEEYTGTEIHRIQIHIGSLHKTA